MLQRPMALLSRQRRETATLALARFAIRNRLSLAVLLVLATLFFLYPIANAVLDATGHRMPGPTVHFKSAIWPHHKDPRPVHHEPHRPGHSV
jgi:hypothetical protein